MDIQETNTALTVNKGVPPPPMSPEEKESLILKMSDAAVHGNLKQVQECLDRGIHPDTKDKDGYTALHNAAYNNHTAVMALLLKARAYVDIKSRNGETTPLHLASEGGMTEAVELLLQAGAQRTPRTFQNYTPLHRASENGHADVVEKLIAAGVSVIGDDIPLRLAVSKGHVGVVDKLIAAGANVDDGSLYHAARFGHKAIVEKLLDAGADVSAKTSGGQTPLEASGKDITPLLKKALKEQELRLAAGAGETKTVQKLLKKGVDPTKKGNHKKTAAEMAHDAGHEELAGILWKAEAERDADAFVSELAGENDAGKRRADSQNELDAFLAPSDPKAVQKELDGMKTGIHTSHPQKKLEAITAAPAFGISAEDRRKAEAQIAVKAAVLKGAMAVVGDDAAQKQQVEKKWGQLERIAAKMGIDDLNAFGSKFLFDKKPASLTAAPSVDIPPPKV